MTITPAGRRRRLTAITWLFGLLIVVEGALVALAGLVVTFQRRGDMSTADAAVFDLLGASAVVGVVIAVLALAGCVAVLRGRPRRLLAASRTLAWLRLAAIPVAAWTIAAVIGPNAVTGPSEAFIVCLALLIAGFGVYGVGSAHRLASTSQ
jgi:uncharacterized membrane protein YhaH (DUF805 family)